MTQFPYVQVSSEVEEALRLGRPVVALETAVVTHGLPAPHNLEIAQRCEETLREEGALPATVAVLAGIVRVGLSKDELAHLAAERRAVKISRRDLGWAAVRCLTGGTTVAATLIAAEAAGIQVFATGGIGGVHREPHDVSADLPEIAQTRVVVVCAGAKSILDLPATLEWLETHGVPVIGFQTDTLPAFYARDSGLKVSMRVESMTEAAELCRAHWHVPHSGGLLLSVPCPETAALAGGEMEQAIEAALHDATERGIAGSLLTPFLLARVASATGGRSLQANLALLENNARHAARLALALTQP